RILCNDAACADECFLYRRLAFLVCHLRREVIDHYIVGHHRVVRRGSLKMLLRRAAAHTDGHSIKEWQMFGSANVGAAVAVLPNHDQSNLQTIMKRDEDMPRLMVGRTNYITAGIVHGQNNA